MDKKEADKFLKDNHNRLVDDSLTDFVSLQGVNKVYPNGFHAVYDFNLDIQPQEFIALVGPSGCGKSTTIRMIAGLEDISSGSLFIDKVYSNYLPSKDRDIAMVFQSYALYPQMNVYDNIAFGLKMRHFPKEEIKKRVFEAADILNLGEVLDRKPKMLSGGQMQRVALGRAIVRQARVFLMDEPLSNLDAKLRVQMRSEIIRIHREVKATTIYVTHDQTEAMTMANRIVVMNKGFVQQCGKPIDIYNHPNNLFVATFIGSPSMNVIKAKMVDNTLTFGDHEFFAGENFKQKCLEFYTRQTAEITKLKAQEDLNEDVVKKIQSANIYVKQSVVMEAPKKKKIFNFKHKDKKTVAAMSRAEVEKALDHYLESYASLRKGDGELYLGIRPENFYFADNNNLSNPSKPIDAEVEMVELLGNESVVLFSFAGIEMQAKLIGGNAINIGDHISLVYDLDKVHVFDIESGLTIQ